MPNNNSNSGNSKGSKKQKDLSDPHHDAVLPNKPGHTLYDPAANPFNLGRSVGDNGENEEHDHAGHADPAATTNLKGSDAVGRNEEQNDDGDAGQQADAVGEQALGQGEHNKPLPAEEASANDNTTLAGADNQNCAADATANAGGAADNDDEDEDDEPAMKRPYVFPPRTPPKKFLPHEILIAIRRVQAGLPVSELCRELGMSNSAFYKWRAKYNGMNDPLLLRMKRLQDHNDMLRKLYVDEKLRTETLQNALQACTHEKVAALKALNEARAQLEAYRNVTWTKKEPAKRTAPKAKAKGK